MKNAKTKRISALVSLLLVVTVLFSGNVFASNEGEGERDNWVPPATSEENPSNYFEFTPSKERVDANGNFNFNTHNVVNSGRFVLSATTTSVTVDADIIDPHGEIVNENYKGHVYAVELYSKGGFQVGRREFVIGGPRTAMFYGFSADKEYYLKISNPTYLPVGWTVKGSGTITNVKSVS